MNDRDGQRISRAGMATSLLAATGASLCCIGPIAAALFGATSLAALVRFEPLRPFLAVLTFAFLGMAFYAMFRRRGERCAPGAVCASRGSDRVERMNLILFWITTAAAILILAFPTWSNWILG